MIAGHARGSIGIKPSLLLSKALPLQCRTRSAPQRQRQRNSLEAPLTVHRGMHCMSSAATDPSIPISRRPTWIHEASQVDLSMEYRTNAGICLINREGNVFVAKRYVHAGAPDPSRNQTWQMPQGGIDEGEDTRSGSFPGTSRGNRGVVPPHRGEVAINSLTGLPRLSTL